MLTKANGEMWLTCDECATETTTYDDFDQMVKDAKADGWQISRNRFSQWEHHCPSCNQENDRLAAAKRLFGKK